MGEISRVEFDALRGDVSEIKEDVKSLRKVLYGANGDASKSIQARIQALEFQIGRVPTWQWLIEKLALPITVSILTAILVAAILRAP